VPKSEATDQRSQSQQHQFHRPDVMFVNDIHVCGPESTNNVDTIDVQLVAKKFAITDQQHPVEYDPDCYMQYTSM
jgi:hypothetical protein